MARTYEPIASVTVGSSVASVTFSDISGSFTDLIIVGAVQISNSGHATLQVNSDTGSNYSSTILYGDGSSVGSSRTSSSTSINVGAAGGASYQSNIFTPYVWQIMSYANTSVFKTVLVTMAQGHGAFSNLGEVSRSVGLWRSTSAITSVTLNAVTSRTFNAGTTFSLFGVKAQ